MGHLYLTDVNSKAPVAVGNQRKYFAPRAAWSHARHLTVSSYQFAVVDSGHPLIYQFTDPRGMDDLVDRARLLAPGIETGPA